MIDSIRPILRWATSFKGALLLSCLAAATLFAETLPGADEAVRKLLPGTSHIREALLLNEDEQKVCAEVAGQKSVGALVSRYVVRSKEGLVGYAYLDKHRVRTLPQTLLVALDAEGAIVGVRVLAFHEPAEYMARDGWLKQFVGKTAKDEIRMKKNIDGITGATLTARAVTQSARRVMAVHQVLEKREAE